MTNENHPKVRDLLDNYDDYMQQLIAMPDKVLERKVRLAIMQSQMALEQQKFVEVDVLCLFRDMIIQARIKRQEMGLEDEEEPKEITDKSVKKRKNQKSSFFPHFENPWNSPRSQRTVKSFTLFPCLWNGRCYKFS